MSDINLQGRRLRVMDVTPELAKLWLDETDTPNRNVSWTQVGTYSRLMKAGKWRPAGDPIRRDASGNVLDGRHRLWAIIDSGVTLTQVVLDGATLEDQDVYDSGRPRRPSQQLAMRGHWKNSTQVAAVVRVVVQWHTGTLIGNSYRPSTIEVMEFADRYRSRLEESVKHGINVGRATGLSKALVGAFAFTAYDKAAEHPEKVSVAKINEFLDLLASGVGLERDNPILVLRNQSMNQKRRNIREGEPMELYRIIATWKAWLKGRRYSKLQVIGTVTADKLTL